MFTLKIPEGFTNAHPDKVREDKDREKKGEMTYADVPAELRDEIITALRQAKTAIYRKHRPSTGICWSSKGL